MYWRLEQLRKNLNWSLLVIAAAGGVVTPPSNLAHAQLTYITSFGSQGTGNGQFEDPAGVALGPDGTVYVSDTNNLRMESFTPTGTFLGVFGASGPGSVGDANGFAVSALGTVYVPAGSGVQTFNSTGTYQGSFGTGGSGNGQFLDADAGSFGPNGVLYIADANNNRVSAFSSTGAFLFSFGSGGANPGQLEFPFGIAVAPSGTVYVADTNNNRINAYTSTGVFQSTIATSGSGNGQVTHPSGLAVSAAGNLYVADYGDNRVEEFNSNGAFITSVGTSGGSGGQFFGPSGIAVAPNGSIYVVNTGNNRVDKFFDPTAWVSGTATFANLFQGPVNVGVGPSPTNDILGTSLTLNPLMTLNCFGLSVDVGGTLTQAGGTLSVGSNPPGFSLAGNFIYQSGTFGVSGLTIVAGGNLQAVQGGLLAVSTQATDGGRISLDGGVAMTAPTLTISSGGQLTMNNATITVPTITVSSGGQLQMESPASSNIAGAVSNSGLLIGTGQISGTLTNNSSGELNGTSNQNLTITGASNTNAGLISLGGGMLQFTQGLSSSGTIEGFGELRVTGGLNLSGTLALAGSSSIFGSVSATAAATIHLSGSTPNAFFSPVNNLGTLTIDIGASGTFYGAYTGNGAIIDNGSLYLNASSVAGHISGNGNLTIGSTSSGPAVMLITPDSGTSTLASLTITSGSQLDLSSNSLVIHNGVVSSIAGEIAQGYNHGAWNGTLGITSSAAAANKGTALAVAQAGIMGISSFNGQNVVPTDALLKYTWLGDANLDGVVNSADLAMISPGAATWSAGDFNYDGVVNTDDYALFMLGEAESGGLNISATLPEPTALSMLTLGIVCAKIRKRR